MSDDHDCEGIDFCIDHPRWHVIQHLPGTWAVYAPYGVTRTARFPSHAAAFDHADRQARKEQA